MRAMGIDPGTKTGVVILDPTNLSETWVKGEVSTQGSGLSRARKIAGDVTYYAIQNKPDVIVIEGYAFANRHSLVTMVEIGVMIRDRLWKCGMEWIEVAPTQLKKFVLGKGVGKKDQMRLAIYKRWGFEDDSDNIVEAYGLTCIGLALEGRLDKVTKAQQEVLDKLQVSE